MRRVQRNLWIPLVLLPIILAVCLSLWAVTGVEAYPYITSEDGEWDLTSFDFSRGGACVVGPVKYVPGALLTPEEFARMGDEILTGAPPSGLGCNTGRLLIRVPEGSGYLITGNSVDYAERMYVNGRLAVSVGVPGATKASTTPDTAEIRYLAEPVDGVIEILRQSSNFVHREGGWYDGLRIDAAGRQGATLRRDVTGLIMGCFLALALIHLALYCQIRSYRANLYFAAFCLIWFMRTGVTGVKLFSSLLPGLSWVAKFRVEYLTLPLTGVLLVLLLNDIFPGALHRPFRRCVYGLSAGFAAFFLIADTYLMSWAMLLCYGYIALSMAYVGIRLIMMARRMKEEQVISLIGVALFFYAGLRDMFFYNGVVLFPFVEADMSQISVLIFALFQMTAVSLATTRRVEEIKSVEAALAAENAALDRLNRMKNDLIATISHETRTPLAILSGYAELISMELRQKGVDLQTSKDLDKIAEETQRIAQLMEGMQNMSREKDLAYRRSKVDVSEVIDGAARLYAPILKRRGTYLVVDAPGALPEVRADPGELTQVLLNLLSNARNHTQNGTVTLRAARDGDFVRIEVEDDGEGIDPAFIPFAFERGRHENPDGSGIGLTICREIITAHGGQIDLRSAPGAGTKVRFTLPIAEGDEG